MNAPDTGSTKHIASSAYEVTKSKSDPVNSEYSLASLNVSIWEQNIIKILKNRNLLDPFWYSITSDSEVGLHVLLGLPYDVYVEVMLKLQIFRRTSNDIIPKKTC